MVSERVVTVEDELVGAYTQRHYLDQEDTIYLRLNTAISEIHTHVKKNQDNSIMAGNFFFKIAPASSGNQQHQLVLIFATQIKAERPLIILNSSIKMTICLQDAARN